MNTLIKYMVSFRFLFFCFICLGPFCVLHAEGDDDGNSNIKGIIYTNENIPAAGVVISLKGTKRNTITDDDGEFHFKNIMIYGMPIF